MTSSALSLWAPLSIAPLTLLAAFVWFRNGQVERIVRLILLAVALLAAIGSLWLTGEPTILSPRLSWLPIPGAGPPITMGIRVDAVTSGLTLAVALLSWVTLAALPAGWRRTDTVLLLTASTAAHMAIIGDHLLLRLAAIEGLLLSVVLLIADRRTIASLLVTQRLAAGALLLAGLILGWPDASTHFPQIERVEAWVPLLVMLAILALGGALPFHRSLRPLAAQSAAPRAHVSALLLLVSGGLSLQLAGQLDPMPTTLTTVGLAVTAGVAAIMSLVALDAGRAQLWMWASQLGFALAVTLHADAAVAVSLWICLALVRPAAAQALDIVQAALGDEPFAARRWGGLAGSLPVACGLSVLAGVAVVALPPFGLFATLAHLLAPLPLGDPDSLPLIGAALFVVLPALRLGLWPFIGASRRSVLAPQEQTSVPRWVAATTAGSAVIGFLWPVSQLLTAHLPPTPVIGASAILVFGLLLISVLLGRRRRPELGDGQVSPWRNVVDQGLPLPSHLRRWVLAVLRRVAWFIDLLGLLPALVTGLLRASAWMLAWIESRPLWWAGAGMVGLI
ncbi:MAG: hypothetical protein HOH74_12455, partial [Gemmatimonadetes bacterium]|nr:hypothetical protein [Gemmatimonadota bacterium]